MVPRDQHGSCMSLAWWVKGLYNTMIHHSDVCPLKGVKPCGFLLAPLRTTAKAVTIGWIIGLSLCRLKGGKPPRWRGGNLGFRV